MKHLGLQSSCRGGKCNTRTPKAPGQRHQHVVGLGGNLLKSTDMGDTKCVQSHCWAEVLVINHSCKLRYFTLM